MAPKKNFQKKLHETSYIPSGCCFVLSLFFSLTSSVFWPSLTFESEISNSSVGSGGKSSEHSVGLSTFSSSLFGTSFRWLSACSFVATSKI